MILPRRGCSKDSCMAYSGLTTSKSMKLHARTASWVYPVINRLLLSLGSYSRHHIQHNTFKHHDGQCSILCSYNEDHLLQQNRLICTAHPPSSPVSVSASAAVPACVPLTIPVSPPLSASVTPLVPVPAVLQLLSAAAGPFISTVICCCWCCLVIGLFYQDLIQLLCILPSVLQGQARDSCTWSGFWVWFEVAASCCAVACLFAGV